MLCAATKALQLVSCGKCTMTWVFAAVSPPALTVHSPRQVENPRTALAYKLKADADGTIDLSSALRAAGMPCDACADVCYICPAARPALFNFFERLVSAHAQLRGAYPADVRLEHPMRVSTYSRQFYAEHDSINADQPVRVMPPEHIEQRV